MVTPKRSMSTEGETLQVSVLTFGVTVPVTVPQMSEIPEGFINYPVF